jgi:hypothetical protein
MFLQASPPVPSFYKHHHLYLHCSLFPFCLVILMEFKCQNASQETSRSLLYKDSAKKKKYFLPLTCPMCQEVCNKTLIISN